MDAGSERVLEQVKKDDVKFVNLWFTDFFGSVKSTSIPVEKLEESLEEGTWFDGSSIQGFARIHESDMILKPDPSTYAVLPWRPREKATARLICDVYTPDGKPFEGDPRNILKRAVDEARDMGFVYNTGPELEFFLFRLNGEPTPKPVVHDYAGYFDYAPKDMASDVRRNIVLAVEEMGLVTEMSHHEVAPGQHEIDFRYGPALQTADNTITLKTVTKSIASSMELHASFMPKPIFGQNGSGMHIHQSLFDDGGRNAFFDKDDRYRLSSTARHFIAGQLEHIGAIAAVVNPSVNSYKRLVSGYEAPVYVCWASTNRSALIRVPRYSPGREQSIRAELRCPDPGCNPYLAFAVMLRAGIDGVKKKTRVPDPVEEDVYGFSDEKLRELGIGMLPSSLKEALEAFARSGLARKTFGQHTFDKYIEAKMKEWESFRIAVTDWEKEKYLGTL